MRIQPGFRTLRLFLAGILTVLPHFQVPQAYAGGLLAFSTTLSNTTAGQKPVTFTLSFIPETAGYIQHIKIRFSTAQGGTTIPAALDLGDATLTDLSGLGTEADWILDASSAASGLLTLEAESAHFADGESGVTIQLGSIGNSDIDDCQPSNDILQDTCHVRVRTYSDPGITLVDTGDTTYTVVEDATLTFQVEDVASGQTHNGVTSNIATSSTSIAFGRLGLGTVRYGTHKLTITTNAPHGYTVFAKLLTNIRGVSYVNNDFDPFGATNATWDTPQPWSTPTGTSPSVNSGWFGANTSDTDILGWSSASGKFGPLGVTPREVAYSSGPDRAGSVIYVSYAIQANILQAAGDYAATLVYDVRPIF